MSRMSLAASRLPWGTVLVLVSACTVPHLDAARAKLPTATRASARPAVTTESATNPGPAGPAAPLALLGGQVGLLVEGTGAPVISNNGGGLVSEHGGGLVSNHGSGLVSNNSGTYRLQATGVLVAAALTDAVVAVEDAMGHPVLDAAGKPLATLTDRQGRYAFTQPLPASAVVLRVKLWQGGELSALVTSKASQRQSQQAIDTASTLGAAYVLDRFVQGDQAKLDRLPAAEAGKLEAGLASASKQLTAQPTYARNASVQLVTDLRARSADVDATLGEIHDLLLGQARLGNGYQATSVAIYGPQGLRTDARGALFFGEPVYGRVRRVASDGTLSTYTDVVRGTVKRNFPGLVDFVRAPDGTFYLATRGQVLRLAVDGTVTTLLGVGPRVPGAAPAPIAAVYSPRHLALAPDGTLYVGEGGFAAQPAPAPRLVAIAPAGAVTELALPQPTLPGMAFAGLACAADGTLYAALQTADPHQGQLLRQQREGALALLAAGFDFADAAGGLAVSPQGPVLVAETSASRVTAVAPDGTKTPRLGAGASGSAAAPDLKAPTDLALGPDGTLYVTDQYYNQIHALRPDGRWERVVGQPPNTPPDPANLGLDSPSAAAYDDQSRLLVVEHGGHRLLRFDGLAATAIAGNGDPNPAGDLGPAGRAQLSYPTGLAYHAGLMAIGCQGGRRIRQIDAAGIISSLVFPVAGDEAVDRPLNPAETPLASKYPARAESLAYGPDGLLYWSSPSLHQVFRERANGVVEAIAGKNQGPAGDASVYMHLGPEQEATMPAREALLGAPQQIAFDAHGDLYVADAGSLLVRKITGLDTATPMISRFAGSSDPSVFGAGGGPGVGAHGGLLLPSGLAFGPDGTLYVSELGTAALSLLLTGDDNTLASATALFGSTNACLSKVSPDGQLTRLGGPGNRLFPDPQAPDGLLLPVQLAFAPDGRLAIVDSAANAVHVLPAGSF